MIRVIKNRILELYRNKKGRMGFKPIPKKPVRTQQFRGTQGGRPNSNMSNTGLQQNNMQNRQFNQQQRQNQQFQQKSQQNIQQQEKSFEQMREQVMNDVQSFEAQQNQQQENNPQPIPQNSRPVQQPQYQQTNPQPYPQQQNNSDKLAELRAEAEKKQQKINEQYQNKEEKTEERIQKTGLWFFILLDIIDPLVGLIPVAGDIIGLIVNLIPVLMLVNRARKECGMGYAIKDIGLKYGLYITLIAIGDMVIGFIPAVGDIIDVIPLSSFIVRPIYQKGLEAISVQKISSIDDKKQKDLESAQKKSDKAIQKQIKSEQKEAQKTATEGTNGGGGSGNFYDKLSNTKVSDNPWSPITIFLIGLIIICCTLMIIYYGVEDSLPALLSPGLLILTILAFHFKGSVNNAGLGVAILFLGLLCMGGAVYSGGATVAFAQEAIMHYDQFGDRAAFAGEEANEEAKKGVFDLASDFIASHERNLRRAAGEEESIDGEVDDKTEAAGISILDPLIRNPDQIMITEAPTFGINARIKGVNPKGSMEATFNCYEEDEREWNDVLRDAKKSAEGFVRPTGDSLPILPSSASGKRFEKSVTCQPEITECGEKVIIITAESTLDTHASMKTLILDEDILIEKVTSKIKFEDESNQEVQRAISEVFPEVNNHNPASMSDKGPIKVIMASTEDKLLALDGEGKALHSGIENTGDGHIMDVSSVEIDLPAGVTPNTAFCRGWEVEGNLLTLSETSLNAIRFSSLQRGDQKVFPTCILDYESYRQYNTPTAKLFLMKVSYTYLEYEEYEVDVRDENGEQCRPERSSSRSGSSTSSGSSSNQDSSSSENSESDNSESSTEITEEQQEQVNSAVSACEGKNEDDSCGTNQFCMNYNDNLVCLPSCKYYSEKGGFGEITENHNCRSPDQCAQGTIIPGKCQSDYINQGYECCI